MFLEDGDWNSANEYCEKVLDMDPEDPSAYLGKLLSELGDNEYGQCEGSGWSGIKLPENG